MSSAGQYVTPTRPGYIFQAPIRQHASIDQITGGRVGTLRMIVLNGDEGPRLFRALWRIPVGRNITDNLHTSAGGNLVAHVDRETGKVTDVVQVVGSRSPAAGEGRALGWSRTSHPDTGEHFSGVTLPHWGVVVASCLNAAAALPGLRYQSWDVAIGPEGPLVLELNYQGGLDIAQIPGTAGFYDAEFREFWKRYATNGKHP